MKQSPAKPPLPGAATLQALEAKVEPPGRTAARHLWIALAAGLPAGLLLWLAVGARWEMALVGGWDVFVLVLLAQNWPMILRKNAAITKLRCQQEDFGGPWIIVVAFLASTIGMVSAILVLARGSQYHGAELWLMTITGIWAVSGSWTLLHTAYALHYARLYYGSGEEAYGLKFPGEEAPDDLDFVYFSFTIGMTFQTADVDTTRGPMRRAVLLHAIISFIYNTTILALTITLLFGRVQSG